MWRKGKPPTLLVGMLTGIAHIENNTEVPLKTKIELPYDPAISLLGKYPEKTIIPPNVHCSTIYNSQNIEVGHKCPPREEWIKKRWYIYTMDYYSDIKRKK